MQHVTSFVSYLWNFLKVRIIHVTQDQWAENTYHNSQNSYTHSLQTEKNENKLLV